MTAVRDVEPVMQATEAFLEAHHDAAVKERVQREEAVQEENVVLDNKTHRSVTRTESETGIINTPVKAAPSTPQHIPSRLWTHYTGVISILVLYLIAVLRETYRKFFPKKNKYQRAGYAPIVKDFDDYWNRRFYRRIRDCWNRPIDSRPSRIIGVMERVSHDHNVTFDYTGRIIPAINMSSYNYLGFAEDTPSITHAVIDSLDTLGIASCSAPQEAGQNAAVARLEKEFAKFIGKDDALICGMGFGTNFRGLPALFGKGTLVISDSLNHRSLVNGVRSSGAKVRPFTHDHFDQLEKILHDAVVLGQKEGGEYVPWQRIVIIVEGVYSMEGEIVDLPRVVELKKKYKALLFVDEAHSIGALGRTGRGVCEHYGIAPADVDVLMGTFTKSFGSIGGYIAADQAVVDYIRLHSNIALHCDTLAPPCAQQILSVLDVILGRDGTDLGKKRIKQLKENSCFLRRGMIDLGLTVLGDDSSPVIPLMCYNPNKLSSLSRKCLERGLAVVVVGYPATPLLEARIRFCVSASHTREDLQYTLDVLKDLCDEVHIRFDSKRPFFLL